MIKKITQFAVILVLISGVLGFRAIAHAQLDPLDDFTKSIEGSGQYETGLQKFEGRPHGLSSVEPGADIITTVIFTMVDFAKYILGTLAILYIVIGGIRLIAAGKKIDEVSEKQKENLKYIIYGLFLAILADAVVQQIFFGEYGECIASATNAEACAEAGSKQIQGIANFISYFLASLAVLIIVISGFRLVTSAGNEETIKKQKTRIAVAIIGLIVVAVSRLVVEGIFFPAAGSKPIDVNQAKMLVAQITNFAASFIATLSIIFLFYGGYRYVASFGNDEATGKAKKIIIGAIIGILIALAAFGFVRTFVTLQPRELTPEEQIKQQAEAAKKMEEQFKKQMENINPF